MGTAAPAASLELRWPDTQQEVLGALLAVGESGWDGLGCSGVWEREREGGGKANTWNKCHDEHWTISDRPGLDSLLNHFPAL